MSNLTNMERAGSRNRLLATVSTLALIASVGGFGPVLADEAKPTLWFELGWNFENVRDSVSGLALPLGPLVPQSGLTAPLSENLNLDRSYVDDGKITFRPEDSDWTFSASVRYGRSRGASQIKQALAPIPTTTFVTYNRSVPAYSYRNRHRVRNVPVGREKLSEDTSNAEAHFIIDFDAGKDVGLGLFGRGSASALSAGVRFAHFALSRKIPNFQETRGIHFQESQSTGLLFYYLPFYATKRAELWNSLSANSSSSQNFNGIGPSIQWEASAELWADPQAGGFFLDWGANAALLFGKQEKKIHHQTTSGENCFGDGCPPHPTVQTSNAQVRSSKSITVPNVGGFVGFSLKYPNLKVSLGYRADLFVNAIDVGFETRKSSNMLFHGPFASVSLGVGD